MRAVTGSALAVLVGMALLTGCSSPSVITLNDGREIQTLDQPEYDDEAGFYEFEGIDGKPGRVNKDQVRTVQEL
ncbi:MAG: YgdI/YgdR family lipoprotein [Pseudomonas sp.]|jgi:major membrane immunogen (membrane-anchored lipoprotein)|uniref:YgdI/YgdR family lipoprotein n=1 Tax=Stutzerimonas xanthomarina TaxID=271420 RepID=UPI000C5B9D4E|nr:YgdI/YgdR family lipoprotein [Stutzerimonas xanthomarina]MAX91250.1 YgdI/YgdR family lipoprotein [Pseudomonas sp.]MBU0813229.1 YgdI/YgdR family lipoprotein [Gammaproteobacteria bacterium]MBK3848585.1 YgdI/YgdR family lipoprotein [Stutzerimonas xanthomarina]MBU0850866.1 YgdI/YgdR family lipoprotein [Gammaproteobacteria bacterium]MBU1301604.1 YgdI/YgdR family lipoprotein [Gammaproteobacteria bacterium]|tara:strand:- start:22019 stop:22240 length:222 start_codon:yes stop_codon:yes gene_type:complete